MNSIEFETTNGIARIRFNRPRVKNALSRDMCLRLAEHLDAVDLDPDVRVVMIESAGADFCSGADMGDMAALTSGSPADRTDLVQQSVRDLSHRIFPPLARLRQPILARVRGHAIGAGFQFVAMADLAIASRTARFSIPQVRLAHSADHGESWFLPRKVGLARATQLMLLGDTIDAVEAERIGLVNWVVADEDLNAMSDELAQRLAAGAVTAVLGMKELLRSSGGNSMDEQFKAELDVVGRCAATEDFVEAIEAFKERRSPVFRGR